jgi:hypothetical protein
MKKKLNPTQHKLKKTGRPSTYSIEMGKEICDVLSTSSLGIKKLCLANSHWPHPDTIYQWLKNHEEFSDQYARGKKLQVEVLVDEILEIADDAANDNMIAINSAKLKIDTRKWIASKLVPRLYGDKIQSEVTGLNTQLIEVNVSDVKTRLFEKFIKLASEKNDSKCDS